MFALVAGRRPAKSLCAFLAHAALAATLAGCAATQTTAKYPDAPTRIAEAKPELEADGLPAQTPPLAGIRTAPDDPSEPYSHNYGGSNPSAKYAPLREAEPENHPTPAMPPPRIEPKRVAAIDLDR